ncbi:hypothetical protein [Streptomyces sp. 6N223]|uniref:hypothetical protein n=1 Tax=Streptomyces sp. 6N223 TaxID=3457412 RepID=UPI003FD4FDAC
MNSTRDDEERERRHRESGERLRGEFGLDEERLARARQWADDVTNRRTRLSLPKYWALWEGRQTRRN